MSVKQIKHRWANGFRSKGVKPDVAWAEIERIRGGRRIVAAQVVEAARHASSPLHPLFEWDDTKAAHEFRLTQARSLLRCIEVEIVREDDSAERTRAFLTVDPEEGDEAARGVYVPMTEALHNPITREQVFRGALAELKGWQKRYARYRALAPVVREVEAVVRKHARRLLKGNGKAA